MAAAKSDWETLKSGHRRKGSWFAGQYPTGWYLSNSEGETFGPFKTFDEAAKEQEKRADSLKNI